MKHSHNPTTIHIKISKNTLFVSLPCAYNIEV